MWQLARRFLNLVIMKPVLLFSVKAISFCKPEERNILNYSKTSANVHAILAYLYSASKCDQTSFFGGGGGDDEVPLKVCT